MTLTIFTPVYNRAYIIEQLYKSLCRQSVKDFEWVVVNDGSTDNINELMSKWLGNDNGFGIQYVTVPNGGKHLAINKGVRMANGLLFFIVDSDDYLLDNAVEMISEAQKILPKNGFAGLSFNKGYSKEQIIGKTFTGKYIDATSLERCKYKIMGDKAEVFYTHILKKYPFPNFKDENFVTETTVWYKIANDGYKIRWFNEIIYICSYLPDGLTANKSLWIRNFKGYTYSTKKNMTYNLRYIKKLKMLGVYMYVAKQKGLSFPEISKLVNVNMIILIFSYCAYFLKKALVNSYQNILAMLKH